MEHHNRFIEKIVRKKSSSVHCAPSNLLQVYVCVTPLNLSIRINWFAGFYGQVEKINYTKNASVEVVVAATAAAAKLKMANRPSI